MADILQMLFSNALYTPVFKRDWYGTSRPSVRPFTNNASNDQNTFWERFIFGHKVYWDISPMYRKPPLEIIKYAHYDLIVYSHILNIPEAIFFSK